jgi:signal recognition particle receptor subunit beta
MAFVNYNNKEITVKIVYYGPALSGKTTCLQYVYESGEYRKKGKLITLDTDGDRTLFFDFLPVEIGKLGDYSIKMQLYTVPGQVAYNTTRKLVLQGSDGIVFVADSQMVMREQNVDSFNNLKENLKANNIPFAETPLIFQYNKRDLKEILPIDILNKDLNPENKAFFPTIGTTGENVLEGLHSIMKTVIIHLRNKLSIFQKDKTVMFSREELTDSIKKKKAKKKAATPVPDPPAEPGVTNVKPKADIFGEDTEREDIFELSSPMPDEPLRTNTYPKEEEDIFDLDDAARFESQAGGIEVPDAVIKDELGDSDSKKSKAPTKKELPEDSPAPFDTGDIEEIGKEYQVTADPSLDGNVNLPIQIEIPKDKDEITINLNLRIVIKKKK